MLGGTDSIRSLLLCSLPHDRFLIPMGIIREEKGECYAEAMQQQVELVTASLG